MALELLGHCGMIWRSLEATLLHRAKEAASDLTGSRTETPLRRGHSKSGDFRDAVLPLMRRRLLEMSLPEVYFSSLRFLNLSPEAGV